MATSHHSQKNRHTHTHGQTIYPNTFNFISLKEYHGIWRNKLRQFPFLFVPFIFDIHLASDYNLVVVVSMWPVFWMNRNEITSYLFRCLFSVFHSHTIKITIPLFIHPSPITIQIYSIKIDKLYSLIQRRKRLVFIKFVHLVCYFSDVCLFMK